MKLNDVLREAEPDDITANLRDLSKHKYNIKLSARANVIERMKDEEFSKLIDDIESSTKDDFIAWHYWDRDTYVFDIAGTKGYQEVADVTKDLRKAIDARGHSIQFFPSQMIKKIDDLYSGMRYYQAHELKVKL